MSFADYGFAVWETFYVTVLATAFSLVIGLPLGVLLVAGDKDGVLPLPGWLMHLLNIVINILRSVPFLILMICVFPLSRAIVGTTVGTKATIVPLVVAAFPFVARLVETSLRELDEGVVEAAQSMGATPFQIITKVMIPECLPGLISSMTTALTTILGYSAMSGAIGGGGLGKVAISYGYYRYFTGMIGWVVAAVSLFFLGLYYTNRNLLYASSDFASVLYTMTMILLFLLPAISMRSFAEERKNRTDQLLLTSPVSIPAIVAGKFLAEVAVFALPLAAAVLMPLILKAFGTVSLVAAYSAVLGYLLLGSACLAVGTWISALTENQILAYLATFGALLVAYIMDGIQTMFTTGNLLAFIAFMVVVLIASILVGVICKRLTAGVTVFCVGAVVLFILFRLRPAWLLTAFNAVLSALALFDPFQDIVGGMFSIPAIVYYLSVIGLFLFLTGQALERRRWN